MLFYRDKDVIEGENAPEITNIILSDDVILQRQKYYRGGESPRNYQYYTIR